MFNIRIMRVESDIPQQRECRKGTLELVYVGIRMPPLTGIHIQLEKINRTAPSALADGLREGVHQHGWPELENICQE